MKVTKCNFCVNRMTQFTLFLTTNWLFRPFDCCKPTCYGIAFVFKTNTSWTNKQIKIFYIKKKPTCVKYLCFGDMNTCAVTRTMDSWTPTCAVTYTKVYLPINNFTFLFHWTDWPIIEILCFLFAFTFLSALCHSEGNDNRSPLFHE